MINEESAIKSVDINKLVDSANQTNKEIEEKKVLLQQWEEYASVFPKSYVETQLIKPCINNTVNEIKHLINNIKGTSNALREAQKKGSDTKITAINGHVVIKEDNIKTTITEDINYNKDFGKNETEAIIEKVEDKKIEQLKTEIKSGVATKESINNIVTDEEIINYIFNDNYEDIFEDDMLEYLTQIINSSEENNKNQIKKMEERIKNELEKNNIKAKQDFVNEEQIKVQALKEIQEENLKKDETIRFDSPYYEKYYCGADVQIWVNNKWFDNIASFQYAITNNKSPVYGYFSENFDAVARGTRLVQGQIGVALTDVQEFNTYIGNISQVDKNAYTKIKDKNGIHEYDKYVGIGFNINIYLGDSLPEHGNITKHRSGTSLKISDCHITNCALYCDTSENPIMMVYNFFARDYSSSLNTLDKIYYNPYDLTVYSNAYGDVNASSYNKNAEKIAREIGK